MFVYVYLLTITCACVTVCAIWCHLMPDVYSVPWGAGQVAVPPSFTVILWQRQMGIIMPVRVKRTQKTELRQKQTEKFTSHYVSAVKRLKFML